MEFVRNSFQIRSFDSIICNLIWNVKKFEKFNKNRFEIRSIWFASTPITTLKNWKQWKLYVSNLPLKNNSKSQPSNCYQRPSFDFHCTYGFSTFEKFLVGKYFQHRHFSWILDVLDLSSHDRERCTRQSCPHRFEFDKQPYWLCETRPSSYILKIFFNRRSLGLGIFSKITYIKKCETRVVLRVALSS